MVLPTLFSGCETTAQCSRSVSIPSPCGRSKKAGEGRAVSNLFLSVSGLVRFLQQLRMLCVWQHPQTAASPWPADAVLIHLHHISCPWLWVKALKEQAWPWPPCWSPSLPEEHLPSGLPRGMIWAAFSSWWSPWVSKYCCFCHCYLALLLGVSPWRCWCVAISCSQVCVCQEAAPVPAVSSARCRDAPVCAQTLRVCAGVHAWHTGVRAWHTTHTSTAERRSCWMAAFSK